MAHAAEHVGFVYRRLPAHAISSPLISIRYKFIKTYIYHLHTAVCCSEARPLKLGCRNHLILFITDIFQQTQLKLYRPSYLSFFVRHLPGLLVFGTRDVGLEFHSSTTSLPLWRDRCLAVCGNSRNLHFFTYAAVYQICEWEEAAARHAGFCRVN